MAKKKKTRSPGESLHHLPEEIIEEILFRLPVKSLLRFRCVSKPWLSVIDSKEFIKRHFKYSKENTDSAHHSLLTFARGKAKQCSLLALLAGKKPSPFRHPISQESVWVSSHCNGVFCFYVDRLGRFLLLNPSTRASKELPKDPQIDRRKKRLRLLKMGLGWDESSGAYKVFVSWRYTSGGGANYSFRYKSRVYSLKTNSWKTVENLYFGITGGEGKFVGGKLHWLSISEKTLTSFDLQSEVVGKIILPVDTEGMRRRLLLGVVGDSLCLGELYFYGHATRDLDLWVMKESWEKLLTIRIPPEILQNSITEDADIIGDAVNGEILIAYERSLLVYCPKNGVICHRRGFRERAKLYVESLTSLDV